MMFSFLSYRKLRFHTIKTLRGEAKGNDVAYATRRRRRILEAIGRKSERRSCMVWMYRKNDIKEVK